ncbi:ninjurin-2-like isoform X3 [Artemia franciscana]
MDFESLVKVKHQIHCEIELSHRRFNNFVHREQFSAKSYLKGTVRSMSFKDRNRNLEMREGSVLPPEVIAVRKGLDTNKYATKKTVAQGLLDVALLTANASQLKYILSTGKQHDFYNAMVALIATSIVLQVLVGILMLSLNFLRDCRTDDAEYKRSSNWLSTANLALVFCVVIINLFISAFDPTSVGSITTIISDA